MWAGVLDLRPDPPHEIGWLDLRTAPGEPATRIHLDPPDPQILAPQVTVTRTAHSPGELALDVIAARILTSAGAVPQDNPWQLAGAGLRAFAGDGPGHIVAALQAAGALAPSSPAPGQLAGLCARLGLTGHGITAPPAAGLPDRWRSMLTRYHHQSPRPAPTPGSWAATAAGLPDVDGVRLAVLGLHQAERGTIVHLHAGGVTMEDDWEFHRAVRPLPALWIRDHAGRWHATRDYAPRSLGEGGEVTLELAIAPPLEAGTPADRPGGRRAIGPGPGQAAAPLDAESVTATQAGCPTLAGLLHIPWSRRTPGHPSAAQGPSPPKPPGKQHNTPGGPDDVPALVSR